MFPVRLFCIILLLCLANFSEAKRVIDVVDAGDPKQDFLRVRSDFKPFIRQEVTKAHMMQSRWRKGFLPFHGRWELVSSVGMQGAIASILFPYLAETKNSVIDIGSGTGALVTLMAELSPHSNAVIGTELRSEVTDTATETIDMLLESIPKFETFLTKVTFQTGNALELHDTNRYGVMNVGFAMAEIHAGLWEALAPGGVLGAPICVSDVKRHLTRDDSCQARYRVFKKEKEDDPVPEPDQQIDEIDKDLKFRMASEQ
eukprot:TRINITY_DN4876_c1_g3_i2.p1 TRINITY_DN4876_c1_g3~~TRINITY_DN4876_c1_g3_i2.p1  ORF type:complete len:274 (+),score=33.59 TRINITY_DN4876_c1_g3_i2:50-823(+)